jgi:PEGA domain/Protein kinase domain
VFRAFDPDRDRLVAVKLFRLDLPPERVHQLVAQFERLIATRVAHPAAIAPVATGIEGVNAYLAQDYVVAESLDITLRNGPLPPADALRVATQLAGALDAAAKVQVGHGVLHPRDVLLSADEARLTGLGIAQAVEHVGVPTQVRRPYTAPERTVGFDWGRRADVFGLAALMHEMLWGRRMAATGEEAARSLTELAGGDLTRLQAVFGRALADDPAERFATASEFTGALRQAFKVARVRLQPSREASADRHSLGVGSQPDRAQTIPLRTDPTAEREPRLPLERPPVEHAEGALEKEPEPVAPPADLDLQPPVLPPELIDSYRPAPDSLLVDEPSRSAISPLAFALVIGAALGFAAGFGVGARGRSTEAAATTESPREFTDAEVRLPPSPLRGFGEPGKPDPTAGQTAPTVGQPDPTVGQPNPRAGQAAATAVKPEGTLADRAGRLQPDLQTKSPKPAPAAPVVGSLLVRSTPLGARVLVDGRDRGRTPLTVGNLSRGAHTVRVIRDGYVADERVVTITTAQRAHSVTARLAPERAAPAPNAVKAAKATASTSAIKPPGPAGPTGQTGPAGRPGAAPLTVESRPAGAKVFIDGRLVGITPLVVPGVTVGEHALYLDHEGYQRWASAIHIITTDKNRVTASLDR